MDGPLGVNFKIVQNRPTVKAWVYFRLSVFNGQIRITVLNYTVVITNELLHLINMLKNLRQILITRALLAPEKGQ